MKFFLFCFLFSFSLFSQTTIVGKATAFQAKEIRLYAYKDFITKSKFLVESTLMSEEGNFKFTLPENVVFSTIYAMFKIENYVSAMYIELNSSYEISIEKPDSVKFYDDRINYINLNILNGKKNETNFELKKFFAEYDGFVSENYSLFLQKAATNKVDSFKTKIWKEYENSSNDELETAIKYNMALLDLMATNNRTKICSDYLSSSRIEYNSVSFSQFFHEFYSKPFESFSGTNTKANLLKAVNEKKSFAEAVKVLSTEKLLENEKIRELVLLKGLYENYNHPDFEKKSIQLVLKEIAAQSNFAQHREIAMNILHELGKLSVGAKAPDFWLIDRNKNAVKLSDFRGKYVYLDFWATWCVPCVKEMPAMEELYKKYKGKIEFVSISIDTDFKTMEKFLKKKKTYDWIFLHYSPEVKEQYNILAIPQYFLIDPDGILIQSPAYRPSGKIEETFMNIVNGKTKNKKFQDW